MIENLDFLQLLNTAVIKSKEKKIDQTYEKRLKKICSSQVLDSIQKAIAHLADVEKISKDEAAIRIVETLRELDNIWSDYVMMEGIDRLKNILRKNN